MYLLVVHSGKSKPKNWVHHPVQNVKKFTQKQVQNVIFYDHCTASLTSDWRYRWSLLKDRYICRKNSPSWRYKSPKVKPKKPPTRWIFLDKNWPKPSTFWIKIEPRTNAWTKTPIHGVERTMKENPNVLGISRRQKSRTQGATPCQSLSPRTSTPANQLTTANHRISLFFAMEENPHASGISRRQKVETV